MAPILGIIASQQPGHISNTAFNSIATVTLSSTSDAITFSSIPSTYKHLQIRGLSKSSYAPSGGQDNVYVRINSDTAGNYVEHRLSGNGSTVSSALLGGTSQSQWLFENPWAGNGVFAPVIIDILDYQNTNKYKTMRMLTGANWNTTSTNQDIRLHSGAWMSTSAITSISFLQTPAQGNDGYFASGCTFALYGIKG